MEFQAGSNDYHVLPATDKQITYARQISVRVGKPIPEHAVADRKALSAWIDEHKAAQANRFANYPSSKQVAFAENIARRRRSEVPHECFRDKGRMSAWITANK